VDDGEPLVIERVADGAPGQETPGAASLNSRIPFIWDNPMMIFAEVAELLRGRFAPAEEKGRDAISLYSAVLKRFGLESSDSVLSARNHTEVREGVRWFYARLSETLGQRSDTWAMRSERTEAEVVELLGRASEAFSVTEFDSVKAVLRIGINRVPGRGKPRGSIAVEAIRVAHVKGQSFTQTISEALPRGSSDLEALERLEVIIGDCDPRNVDWKPAAKWSLGYSKFSATDPDDLSLAAYCAWISDDWSFSDADLLGRLERLTASLEPVAQ